jgi:hypothetical protein
MKMVNPTSRVIDLWAQWNKVCNKYYLTYIVEDLKEKNEWRK